jgi:hypothetical protein
MMPRTFATPNWAAAATAATAAAVHMSLTHARITAHSLGVVGPRRESDGASPTSSGIAVMEATDVMTDNCQ